MPRRILRAAPSAAEAPLRMALRALRKELDLPGAFPPDVIAEAEQAARAPRLPSHDATDIPFCTIDPPGSSDIDHALHLARRGKGFRVHYATADVTAFVVPGGAVDAEAHRRVNTLCFPDGRVPLHPTVLSEGAAGLLPNGTHPAVLWRIDLDADGDTVATEVRRALVRSRARLDFPAVQHRIDAGTAEEPITLIEDIGRRREEQERDRGGISLTVPAQEISERDGGYRVDYRATLPVDGWKAQLSLLTGMAAAELMTTAGIGVLRTVPLAPDGAVARLRRVATALRIDWPHHVPYAAVVRSLDPANPRNAAFLQACTDLLRGAGYSVFDHGELPDPAVHAAVAAPYTHCTAPLRRLVDRYAAELCVAAFAGDDPPAWVRAALPRLPNEMAEGAGLADTVERACAGLVDAALLKDRIGELFDGCVIDVQDDEPTAGTVHLTDPAVPAPVTGAAPLRLGERLRVRLAQADPGTAKVRFAPA